MKVSDRVKTWIRFGLWVASLTWGVLFLTLGLLLMPAVVAKVKELYEGVFVVGVISVAYVLMVLTALIIFFWFFERLSHRK